MELTPEECRALGCLVEKAMTTAAQYPLTLNGVVVACNQKNNRDPVVSWGEDRVIDALDGLRAKGLAREVMLSGSRVTKYRHTAREGLEVETPALCALAELLLRGPQTVGELRSRASRMQAFESVEAMEAALRALAERETPLVRQLPPAPGSRAPRWAQTLCPTLHQLDAPAPAGAHATPSSGPDSLERLERLEREVARLREQVDRLLRSGNQPSID